VDSPPERAFDHVVVGGGTAGCIVAARLAEDPKLSVCLVEAGPPDTDERVLVLANHPQLYGTELDYDYALEPQPRGNSQIRQSAARVLGGCASHNGGACFKTPDLDLRAWEAAGASGWGPSGCAAAFRRVFARVPMEYPSPDNAVAGAFLEAAAQAGYPTRPLGREDADHAAGRLLVHRQGELRMSTSVCYLHPLDRLPANLTVLTGTQAHRIAFDGTRRAVGVETTAGLLSAGRGIVLACGSFETPKLLLLSGVGGARQLRELGIPVVADVPGVGEHLLDHPEGVVNWETSRSVAGGSAQRSQCAAFLHTEEGLPWSDVECVFVRDRYDLCTIPLGYPSAPADHGISMCPHVSRPRSEGVVRLRCTDPTAPPIIDPRHFSDPDGYDERTLVAGVRLSRRLAEMPALAHWIARELSPGPGIVGDAELSDYVRSTSNTGYHPVGTCRMGAPGDAQAVVDPSLRVRGVQGLRVADASIFPTQIGVNPVVTVMMIGERVAELIAADR
jgi:choline oxidase